MEDFPLADADTGVTALMRLVTVMATEVLHGAIIRDGYFIDGKKAKTRAIEILAFGC